MQSRLIQETPPAPPLAVEPSVFNRLSRLPALRPSTLRLLSISVDSDSAMSEFENGRVVSSDTDPERAIRAAKDNGCQDPVLVYVPEKDAIQIY